MLEQCRCDVVVKVTFTNRLLSSFTVPSVLPACASQSLLDGLGFGAPSAPVAPAHDMLSSLFSAPAPAPAPTAFSAPAPVPSYDPAAAAPRIVAFEGNGLRVLFDFKKPNGPDSGDTTILATFTNASTVPFTNFQFQVAVPKVRTGPVVCCCCGCCCGCCWR